MTERFGHKLVLSTKSMLCAAALLAVAPAFVFGQGTAASSASTSPEYVPTLTFDVASIRQSNSGYPMEVSGDSPLHASTLKLTNNTVVDLIDMAYPVSSYSHILGGPAWLKSDRFNVQARSDSSVDEKLAKLSDDQAKLEKQHMLQVLLADRFQLKVHWETREGRVYALEVAKKGPKFREATARASGSEEVKGTSDTPLRIYQQGDGVLGYEFIAQGCSMKELSDELAGQLAAVVVDKTGLTGNYDFKVQYHGTRSNMRTDDVSTWPPLETAIEEQLGLSVKPAKGPVLFLVIDHVEKPSEN